MWLRWVLCEAAQTAKRHPQFAASFQRIAHRRGKKIATTAIARKLLTRAFDSEGPHGWMIGAATDAGSCEERKCDAG